MIIYTEYKGPTAARGASIYVSSGFAPGQRFAYDYDAKSPIDMHAECAKQYADKLKIGGTWAGSAIKDGGYVFVRIGVAGFKAKT